MTAFSALGSNGVVRTSVIRTFDRQQRKLSGGLSSLTSSSRRVKPGSDLHSEQQHEWVNRYPTDTQLVKATRTHGSSNGFDATEAAEPLKVEALESRPLLYMLLPLVL